MGKGDRRTRRGKLYRGTYGKRRSHETNRPQRELQPPTHLGRAGKASS